jgi:hypothetical protein
VLRTCTRPLSCAFVERRLGPEGGSTQNGSQLQPRFRAAGKYTGKYLYSRMNRLAVNQQYQQHSTWPCPYHCRNLPERQDLSLLVAGGTCRPDSDNNIVATQRRNNEAHVGPSGESAWAARWAGIAAHKLDLP